MAKPVEKHSVSSNAALQALLKKFPEQAKVYVDVTGSVVVRQGKKELVRINLTGF